MLSKLAISSDVKTSIPRQLLNDLNKLNWFQITSDQTESNELN